MSLDRVAVNEIQVSLFLPLAVSEIYDSLILPYNMSLYHVISVNGVQIRVPVR